MIIKMKKKIQKKYAGGTLLKLYMCLICFGQATPYCIIAGCSKRYDVTTHRQGSEQLSKKTAMDSNQNGFCLKFEIKMRVVCVWFRVELSGSLKSKCMLFVWFRIELSGSLKPK